MHATIVEAVGVAIDCRKSYCLLSRCDASQLSAQDHEGDDLATPGGAAHLDRLAEAIPGIGEIMAWVWAVNGTVEVVDAWR
jgi:hypothetical protein